MAKRSRKTKPSKPVRSEQPSAYFLESLKDLNYFMIDAEYRYLSFTKEHAAIMKRLAGVKIAVGMNILENLPARTDKKQTKQYFDKALKGKSFKHIQQYDNALQSMNYLELHYGPVKSVRGKIIGIHVWVMDVTSHNKAKVEANHFSSLLTSSLESVNHGILILDLKSKITFFNNQFQTLFKIPEALATSGGDEKILNWVLEQIETSPEFLERIGAIMSNHEAESHERITLIDGRFFSRYTKPHYLGNKIVGRVWSFQDVTAQELSEREIRHLASFPLHSPEIVIEVNEAGELKYGNPAFYEVVRRLGLDDHTAFLLNGILETPKGLPQKATVEAVVKGRTFSLKIFYLPEKELTRIYAFDLTDRLEAEKQKSDLELTYRTLFESATDSIMLMDIDEDSGKILSANQASATMYGHTLPEFLKLRIQDLDVIEPGVHITYEERLNNILQNQRQVFEVLHRKKDGTLLPLEAVASIFELSGKRVQLAIMRDITQRKKAEDEIRLQYRFIESLAAASPDVVYVYDLEEEKYVYANERMAEAYGYPLGQLLEKGHDLMLSSLHEDDIANIPMWLDQVKNAKDGDVIETRFRLKSSTDRWRTFQSREAVFLRNSNGLVKQFIGSSIDITIQVEAEEALRESEQRFRVLHEASFAGIAIHDLGVIRECNAGLSRMTGYSHEELIGFDGLNLIHPDDRAAVLQKIQSHDELPYDVRGLRKDGSLVSLEIKGKSVPYKGKLLRVTEFRDVSERVRTAERILEQNTKLQAIAENLRFKNQQLDEFTQIVSHNLRAPAGNIVSLTEFLAVEKTPEEREKIMSLLKHSGASILTTLTELNEVLKIKQAKNIGKQNHLFEDVHQRACQMLNAQIIATQAEFATDFSQTPAIEYPHIYLESIFLNLISNALKYYDPSRPLRISCRTYMLEERICLEVADTGLGINLERYGHQIFKMRKTFHHHPDSRGIGLFMIKNQVEAMGGKISVESREGEGSVFRIVF